MVIAAKMRMPDQIAADRGRNVEFANEFFISKSAFFP